MECEIAPATRAAASRLQMAPLLLPACDCQAAHPQRISLHLPIARRAASAVVQEMT